MNSGTPKLRLGPLPPCGTVRLTFTCPIALKADLDRYAAAFGRVHQHEAAVDLAVLIPHMLEAFMARDRGFKRVQGSLAGRNSEADE